jgi:GAF domain-containing protein/predicted Ser/Thr protein kinase
VASPNRHSRPVTRAPGWWATALIVAFGIVHTSLQIAATRPYLPPAGDGAFVIGDIIQSGVGAGRLLVARPPALDAGVGSTPPTVGEVLPGSPAARAGVHAGDTILQITNTATGRSVTFLPRAGVQRAIAAWRDAYWVGLSGPVVVSLRDREGRAKQARIAREPVWRLGPPMSGEWTATHLGPLIQLVTFVTCAAVLLALRPRDPAAQFSIAALVFAGVGATGPLAGGELALPNGARQIMTVLAWLSTALAFPTVALAISYFPRKAAILTHHRWLHAIPFVVAAPIAVTSGMTGAYLSGVNGLADAAAWDASHPMLFLWIFGVGLSVNIAAMVESVIRFRKNPDGQERRRVALSVWTLVIGTLAFTLRDGVPVLLAALGGARFTWPAWIALPLYVLVALPAIGVTYAVAVHRVLSPRVAMRSSLQYALARKTLTAAAVLPAVLLVVSLVRKRDQSLSAIVAGQPLLYAGALAMFLVALRFRDRARAWLDRRFFRTDYDARSVLVSLAGRVPFQTDPNELTALVLDEIDRSLKPSMAAVLVSGLEPGSLVPVAVLRGSADSLSDSGGIASMLQWSNEPLELYLDDTRSPARRLPPDEIAWLECTGAILFVPLYSKDSTTRTVLGALALGGKRSEEPYSSEDRELLTAIAAQVSLALDVARLRRRDTMGTIDSAVTMAGGDLTALAECPSCHACYDTGAQTCASDGAALTPGALPRVVDGKYRVDRALGRGGMGAVYRARDMRLDRDVAIKVVRSELLADADARARFRREAQVVARLQHPGVVSVFDYGTLGSGAAFLVMEFVRGRDLRSLVLEGPQSPEVAIRLLQAIAAPVEAAHKQGILHRDLKPENILLPEDGVDAKVLDFGIAKVLSAPVEPDSQTVATLTTFGQPLGTPAYMAPEQLTGEEMTARTDVYALGVIGYELVTGMLPFGRGSFLEIAMRQQRGAPTLAGQDLPDGLATAIADALSTDPAARPASASAFAGRVGSL